MDLAVFVELETQVWEALRRGDAEADERLLADDFLGVYPTGFANRSDHVEQLAGGPTVADYELHDARIKVLSEDEALLASSCRLARARRRRARRSRIDVRQLPLVSTSGHVGEPLQSGLPRHNLKCEEIVRPWRGPHHSDILQAMATFVFRLEAPRPNFGST